MLPSSGAGGLEIACWRHRWLESLSRCNRTPSSLHVELALVLYVVSCLLVVYVGLLVLL